MARILGTHGRIQKRLGWGEGSAVWRGNALSVGKGCEGKIEIFRLKWRVLMVKIVKHDCLH